MYQILRKESLRAVLPRIIICAVLAIALFSICGAGLTRVIAGPAELSGVSTEALAGKYVTFDASEVIVACASLSQSGDSGTTVLETYYLLPVGDGQYMCVMDPKEQYADVLSRAMEQSHEYYLGSLETLTPLGKISGFVTEIDEDMPGYMISAIENYELPGYTADQPTSRLIVPYQINLGKVGFLPKWAVLVLAGCAALFLLLLILQLVLVFSGFYQKQVRALIGDADTGFQEAERIEEIRVGDYIWYAKGPRSRAVLTNSLIWGYALPEPMVVSKYRWPVALYDNEQRMIRLQFMEQADCQKLLNAVEQRAECFRVGYSAHAAEQFQQGAEAFMKTTRAIQREADKS